jgi:NDP-sugar pyrophosphorylase family protein
MKAMILAAGLGTRLRPLTDDRPKALVTVAGRTLLEIALCRLRAFGVREVIVNAHHYAEMIVEYLKANDNFGMRIEVSREEELLDTGGGLKKAAHFFLEGQRELARAVHPAQRRCHQHDRSGAHGALSHGTGRAGHAGGSRAGDFAVSALRRAGGSAAVELGAGRDGEAELVRAAPQAQALAFSGIHVLSPQIFAKMKEEGAFSIIDAYLRLAAQGEKIIAFRADECYWRDLGRPENYCRAGGSDWDRCKTISAR